MSDTTNIGSFFIEDAPEIQKVIGTEDVPLISSDFTSDITVPVLTEVEPAGEVEMKKAWKSIRSFFRNGNSKKSIKNFTPLLSLPYQSDAFTASDYPIWISDVVGDESCCRSLQELLTEAVSEATGGVESSILKNNIVRIVKTVDESLAKNGEVTTFYSSILSALDDLAKRLNIPGDDGKKFDKHLKRLRKVIPTHGILVPYNSNAGFQIFGAMLQQETGRRSQQLSDKILKLKCKLQGQLAIDHEKEEQDPKELESTLSFASELLDFEKVSKVLPDAGAVQMSASRKKRLEDTIAKLEIADKLLKNKAFVFIGDDQKTPESPDWKLLLGDVNIKSFKKGGGYTTIKKAFEQEIEQWTLVIAGIQIAELELAGRYMEDVHDEYFESLTWRDFSEDEITSCPPFVLIASEEYIADSEMGEFSKILSKGILIRSLILKNDIEDAYKSNGVETESNFSYRQELGAFVISHRNAFVCQSTAIKPLVLYNELKNGLTVASPGAFFLLSSIRKKPADSYMWVSAAVSGREYPGFTFSGNMNSHWGSRFNIDNNFQAENVWPIEEVIAQKGKEDETITAHFTYADFATFLPKYTSFFQEVEQCYWNENLLELAQYLKLDKEEAVGKVPFIWMVDEKLHLKKVAVAWPLVLKCRERQDFWRFLQESSGVNNYHVKNAIAKAEESLGVIAAEKMEALKAEHQVELQAAVDEAAGQAMDKLSAVLLDMDAGTFVPGSGSSAPGKAIEKPAASEESDTPEVPAEAGSPAISMAAEAYIDTALCTSCNECTNLNGSLFNYNDDKMAFIADINAGTFEELVEAAELCPVGIIHPGDPVNNNEPGLDALIERAKKFN